MTRRHGVLVAAAISAAVAGAGVLAEGRTAKRKGDVIGSVTVRNGKHVVSDLSQLVVFIDDENLPTTAPTTEQEMRQRNEAFEPAFLVVERGTTVSFPNQDRKEHNVFSQTLGNDFDLGRYKHPESASTTFSRAGEVVIGCGIHRRMSATIYVVPNKYFDASAGDGKFRIKGLPAGTYKVTAWIPGAAEVSTKVTVVGGKIVTAPALTLVQGQPSRPTKDDPRGRESEY